MSRFKSLALSLCLLTLTISNNAFAGDPPKRGVQLGIVNASDIDDLSTWHPNVVRFQLSWADQAAADASDETSYNAWLDSALAHLDELMPSFQKYHIQVLLNLHTPPGGFENRRPKDATHRLFTDAWTQPAYIRAWQKIANRYKGNTTIFAYDLLNEPAEYRKPAAPLKDWNTLGAEAAVAIREIEPTRTLMMTPKYGNPNFLKQLKPLKMPNVLYTIHYYQPFKFLHQGLGGIKFGLLYPTKKDNKASLLKDLEKVDVFQRKNKAKIFVGEFSVARWAPNGSALKYLKDITSIYEKKKWSWTYHAFREADVWSLEHGSDRFDNTKSPTDTDRLKLIKKLFAKNKFVS